MNFNITKLMRSSLLMALMLLTACSGGGSAGGNAGATYSVGGTLTGLSAGNKIILTNNGTDNLPLNANGAFSFATTLANGAAYNLTLAATIPTAQPCTSTYGAGTIKAANVTNLNVICGLPPGGSFVSAASLATGRQAHTATLLPDGRVLAAGGVDATHITIASAEIYDPANNTWTAAANLSTPRAGHTATLLPDGMVLVAGGRGFAADLASAELYDPASNTWTAAASLVTAREFSTATLLSNGKVLVVGGSAVSSGGTAVPLSSAELYDPATNTWTTAGSLAAAHLDSTATLLPNGKVLVVGGVDVAFNILATAELYDSASNTWTGAASPTTGRSGQRATLLPNGKVLVTGGGANFTNTIILASAELYDPANNTWSQAASLASARSSHSAVLLPTGQVLVAGGWDSSGAPLASAELYNSASDTWTATGNLVTGRALQKVTLLNNGKVLVVGGFNAVPLSSAELYW